MKRFKYTSLYLLAFIGTMLASCSESELADEYAKTQLSLSINMAETKAAEGKENGLAAESYIDDITVFLFTQAGDLIEQPTSFLLGTDGNATRTVIAQLNQDYSKYTNVEVVVLANLNARYITLPESINNKQALYSSLVYNYNNVEDWKMTETPKQYIPMSGHTNISITTGTINQGTISMYRAIARVDVVFNEGKGFDNFTPTEIVVTRYNDKGHCASDDGAMNACESPKTNEIELFQPNTTEKKYRIYLPEFQNSSTAPAQIKITGNLTPAESADGTTVKKTYYLDFNFNDNKHSDIKRNNIYRFLITKINNEIEVTTGIKYEVEKWGTITVNVPDFK